VRGREETLENSRPEGKTRRELLLLRKKKRDVRKVGKSQVITGKHDHPSKGERILGLGLVTKKNFEIPLEKKFLSEAGGREELTFTKVENSKKRGGGPYLDSNQGKGETRFIWTTHKRGKNQQGHNPWWIKNGSTQSGKINFNLDGPHYTAKKVFFRFGKTNKT